MNSLKITSALLAAGGALGAAASAQATTVDLNISGLAQPTDIALVSGAPAQFSYGYDDVKAKSSFAPEAGAMVGSLSDHYVSPSTDTSYSPFAVKTASSLNLSDLRFNAENNAPPGYKPYFEDAYANLKFSVGQTDYIGTAHFAGDEATLETITFDTSGAPEPQAWALLIAGVGVAGAAMRRRAQPATA